MKKDKLYEVITQLQETYRKKSEKEQIRARVGQAMESLKTMKKEDLLNLQKKLGLDPEPEKSESKNPTDEK